MPPTLAVPFLWKESIQRFTRNLLVPWPPTEGGTPPSIPPTENRALRDSQGQWLLRLFSVEAKTLPCPLSTPPEKHKTFVVNKGERHGVTVGARQCYRLWKNKVSCHCPQEWNGCSILKRFWKIFSLRRYLRGSPLDTLLDTFLVKEKYPREWAAQAHITNWQVLAVLSNKSWGDLNDFRVLSLSFFRKPKRKAVPNFKLVQKKNLSSDWGIDFF